MSKETATEKAARIKDTMNDVREIGEMLRAHVKSKKKYNTVCDFFTAQSEED